MTSILRKCRVISCVVALLVPVFHAHAGQITVTSDDLEIQCCGSEIIMLFSKDAKIRENTFSLSGDSIKVVLDNNSDAIKNNDVSSVKEIHSIGNATFEHAGNSGRADRITILAEKKIMTLEGNASVSDTNDRVVHGEKIVVDGVTKEVISGQSTSGRSSISIGNTSSKKPPNDENGKNGERAQ